MNSILDDFKNAFKRPNYELYQVIYVTVAFWIVQAILSVPLSAIVYAEGNPPTTYYDEFLRLFAMPANSDHLLYRPWTVFTYMLPHDGIFHILFNMLILYYFGRLVVEYLGSRKFLVIYILGGLAGGIVYFTIYNLFDYYDSERAILLGASGGVLAIVTAAATLMPNYTFHLLLLGPVRIKYIALFYAISSYLGVMGSNAGGELAHLGGILFGFSYIKSLQSGTDIGAWFSIFLDWLGGLFKPRSNIRVSYRKEERKSKQKSSSSTGKKAKAGTEQASQEEIDAILDKISDSGYDSLSKEEKRKLFEASKK